MSAVQSNVGWQSGFTLVNACPRILSEVKIDLDAEGEVIDKLTSSEGHIAYCRGRRRPGTPCLRTRSSLKLGIGMQIPRHCLIG